MKHLDELQQDDHQHVYFDENETKLSDLLLPLWHARKLIIGVTLGATVIGGVGSMILSKYKSEGFFQFGGAIPLQKKIKDPKDGREIEPPTGIAISDYKRYAAAFHSAERFAEYTQEDKLTNAPEVINLRKTFASREGISARIEPIYSFTKLDAKELGGGSKDSDSNVIGLRINYASASPESAQKAVGLLGTYAMDTIVYLIYSDALRFKHAEMNTKITELENDIISSNEKQEQYKRKGNSLKQIITRYPDSANQATRQVVTVTEESARYLSPVAQLMSSEVEFAEASEAILKAKREQQQYKLLREYYDRVKVLLDSTKSGETILRGLEPIKHAVFKDKNMEDEAIRQVFNKLTIENQSALNLYLDKSRFIAGPSLPENRTERLSLVLLLSALLGLLAAGCFVFVRNWLQKNSTQIEG
ncbi:lipopolysaccharide biosynthesis protein [Janthinobacterium svalbardensis]|uniref:lipopolysaccharide biosynthesis protein n=1 Tax=Janthinobacterium svalbardensis TaxID=368607 RepID=UPI002FCD8233